MVWFANKQSIRSCIIICDTHITPFAYKYLNWGEYHSHTVTPTLDNEENVRAFRSFLFLLVAKHQKNGHECKLLGYYLYIACA